MGKSKQGFGRNSPCWCGSGRKYKHCHDGRAEESAIPTWLIGKAMKKAFSAKTCLAPTSSLPECVEKICKAHTIPKSLSLKSIAREGMVYGFDFKFDVVVKNEGKLVPQLVHINKASVFTGFCQKHDNDLFADVEKKKIIPSDSQCFLLAYRAIAREFYTKSAALGLSDFTETLDSGRDVFSQMRIQSMLGAQKEGLDKGLEDLKQRKLMLDEIYVDKLWSRMKSLVFRLSGPPPVMVSGAINPDFDFNGAKLQNLGDLDLLPDILAVNSFFDGDAGYIVLSFFDVGESPSRRLVASLLERSEKESLALMVQYILKSFENIFISPNWWEGQSDERSKRISKLFQSSVSYTEMPSANGMLSVILGDDLPDVLSIQEL
ncbi:SEC-C domain-containing protein [Akkermansiaceae bacterium]|nr:SEC-C domain-containing protein [Akkermansiaceae bacterium]